METPSQKLLNALDNSADRGEVSEVFELFLGLLRKLKEDTDAQAQAIYAELDSKINTIKSLSEKSVLDSEHKLDKKIVKAFADAQETVTEAKAYLADRITDVKRSIPEQKEFDPSPTYIKEKLLQAGLTTKDIKGTEALVDKSTLETAIVEIGGNLQIIEKRNSKGYGALGGGSEGTGSLFLSRLRDVDLTGLTMLNGKYQLGSGTGGGSSISLTTTGSSGPATLIGNVLNIPVYSGGGSTPGGSNTQLQYNNAGVFGGISRITSNGTNLFLTGEASPVYAAGKLVYDTDNESLTFFNNEAMVSLQVGQEEWIRVINNTGSTIANGAAVYISGAASGLLQVSLAQSNAAATTIGAGLATQSIANGAIGYVTVIGVVRGLNTAAFTAGQTVYISSTVAGGLVTTAPLSPNYRYRIGIVGVSSSTVGTIHVTPSTAALGNGTANQVFGMNTAGTAQEVKSILGTANRISITNATNSITADIAATYVGQSSITTLGTIGTGTWQGTLLAGQYGGTGVANTGKTITLGGNLTTSGAFATTLTSTATTNVTLPATGTLATLAGTEALTNKSVNGVTLTTGGGTTTFLNANGTYTTPAGGGSGTVTNVATDTTLTGGPITTTGTLGINLANSNTWTASQSITANASGFILDLRNTSGSGTGVNLLRLINTASTGSGGGTGPQSYTGVLPTTQGDRLGYNLFGYTDGTTNRNAAGIFAYANQAFTAGTNQGSYITFETTANNSATRTERLRIGNNGDVTIMNLATGLVKSTSGVLSNATAGTDYVTPAGTETLSNKTLTSPVIASSVSSTVGSIERDGNAFYATNVSSSRQVVDTEQLITLTSNYTLVSQTAAQQMFNSTANGALTVASGTAYFFECYFVLTSLSTTSNSFGFAIDGTAVLASQTWNTVGSKTSALTAAAAPQITFNTAANTVLTASNVQTNGQASVKGIIRVTTGGTIVPQVSMTVANAAAVNAGSYFRIWPIGSNAVTNVGNWS